MNVEVADKCLVEAYDFLVKANDLLFDAGWHKMEIGPKLAVTDCINEAIAQIRHARYLKAKMEA